MCSSDLTGAEGVGWRGVGVGGTGIPLKNGLPGVDCVVEDGGEDGGLSALAR